MAMAMAYSLSRPGEKIDASHLLEPLLTSHWECASPRSLTRLTTYCFRIELDASPVRAQVRSAQPVPARDGRRKRARRAKGGGKTAARVSSRSRLSLSISAWFLYTAERPRSTSQGANVDVCAPEFGTSGGKETAIKPANRKIRECRGPRMTTSVRV